MKKKTMLLTIVFTLLVGGTVGAMIDVNLDRITNKSEEVKAQVDKAHAEYKQDKRHMVLTSTDRAVQENIKRLEKEVLDYYYNKQYRDLNDAVANEVNAIKKLTDQKIAELKAHIDTLFSGGAKG